MQTLIEKYMIHLPVNYVLARDNENVGLFLSFEDPPPHPHLITRNLHI